MESELRNSKGWDVLVRDVLDGHFFIIAYDQNGNCIGCGVVDNLVSSHVQLHKLTDRNDVVSVSIEDLFS